MKLQCMKMLTLFLPTERHTAAEEQNVKEKVSVPFVVRKKLKCQRKGRLHREHYVI